METMECVLAENLSLPMMPCGHREASCVVWTAYPIRNAAFLGHFK